MEQIKDLAGYLGVKDRLTSAQVIDSADVIIENYGFLKLSEFMLFFFMVKSGMIGELFGSIDGRTLCRTMAQFMAWRNVEVGKIERNRAEEFERKERDGVERISVDEWEALKESWIMWAGFYTPDTWNLEWRKGYGGKSQEVRKVRE